MKKKLYLVLAMLMIVSLLSSAAICNLGPAEDNGGTQDQTVEDNQSQETKKESSEASNSTDDAPPQNDIDTGEEANSKKSSIIGTWKWVDIIVNPYLSLSGETLANAQSEAEGYEDPPFTDQDARIFDVCMTFKEDGTGLDYYLYEDGSAKFVEPFWWRIDENNDIIVCFLGLPDTTEWSDDERAQLQRFQDGDYTDIADPGELDTYREESMNLYGLGPGGASNTCILFEKVSEAQELSAQQATSTPTQASEETNDVSIGNIALEDLQGEWRGTGKLTMLENIEVYEWNWEVLSAEEAALYNSMVGVENVCYFEIDQDNDIGVQLLAAETYWRGFADNATDTTLINGELSAAEKYADRYTCQVHATLSRDTDGALMLQGTVDVVEYQESLDGSYDEISHSIVFSVKKTD